MHALFYTSDPAEIPMTDPLPASQYFLFYHRSESVIRFLILYVAIEPVYEYCSVIGQEKA